MTITQVFLLLVCAFVPIYTLMENLRWLKANGGVEAADKRAHECAETAVK